MVLSNLAIVAVLAAVTYLVLFRRHNRFRATGRASARAGTGHGTPVAGPASGTSMKSQAQPAASAPAGRMCTHAVSIERDLLPCDAAKALADKRFLSHEAPDLPLAGCDRDKCTCRYIHHSDRRSNEERRLPFVTHKGFGFEIDEERRQSNDRRRS
jgi:hypothetical protein